MQAWWGGAEGETERVLSRLCGAGSPTHLMTGSSDPEPKPGVLCSTDLGAPRKI